MCAHTYARTHAHTHAYIHTCTHTYTGNTLAISAKRPLFEGEEGCRVNIGGSSGHMVVHAPTTI